MVFLNWCSFDIKKESSWNNFKECKIKFLPFTCAYFTLQLLVCSDYNKNHSFAKIVAFTGSSSAWNFWQKGVFSAYLFSSMYIQVQHFTWVHTLQNVSEDFVTIQRWKVERWERWITCRWKSFWVFLYPFSYYLLINTVGGYIISV